MVLSKQGRSLYHGAYKTPPRATRYTTRLQRLTALLRRVNPKKLAAILVILGAVTFIIYSLVRWTGNGDEQNPQAPPPSRDQPSQPTPPAPTIPCGVSGGPVCDGATYFCNMATGSCMSRRDAGDACSETAQCKIGLKCDNSVCAETTAVSGGGDSDTVAGGDNSGAGDGGNKPTTKGLGAGAKVGIAFAVILVTGYLAVWVYRLYRGGGAGVGQKRLVKMFQGRSQGLKGVVEQGVEGLGNIGQRTDYLNRELASEEERRYLASARKAMYDARVRPYDTAAGYLRRSTALTAYYGHGKGTQYVLRSVNGLSQQMGRIMSTLGYMYQVNETRNATRSGPTSASPDQGALLTLLKAQVEGLEARNNALERARQEGVVHAEQSQRELNQYRGENARLQNTQQETRRQREDESDRNQRAEERLRQGLDQANRTAYLSAEETGRLREALTRAHQVAEEAANEAQALREGNDTQLQSLYREINERELRESALRAGLETSWREYDYLRGLVEYAVGEAYHLWNRVYQEGRALVEQNRVLQGQVNAMGEWIQYAQRAMGRAQQEYDRVTRNERELGERLARSQSERARPRGRLSPRATRWAYYGRGQPRPGGYPFYSNFVWPGHSRPGAANGVRAYRGRGPYSANRGFYSEGGRHGPGRYPPYGNSAGADRRDRGATNGGGGYGFQGAYNANGGSYNKRKRRQSDGYSPQGNPRRPRHSGPGDTNADGRGQSASGYMRGEGDAVESNAMEIDNEDW